MIEQLKELHFQLSWMDESIVSSAKTIVARKLRESGATSNPEENGGAAVPSQLQQLEKVLFAQAANIQRLEAKIDTLLKATQ